MVEDDKPDMFNAATGAQKLAFDTAMRILIEHASATDPDLRHRIVATVEAYVIMSHNQNWNATLLNGQQPTFRL